LRELAAQLDSKRRESTATDQNRGGTDQVMVCLGSRPQENALLLRYGSRMAGRLNRNWYAVHVQTLGEDPIHVDATHQRQMSEILTLANQLGAAVFTFKGEEVADTLLSFAKEYRVGYVLIGRPSVKSLWRRLSRKQDVASQLLRDGQDFNLLVINTRNRAEGVGEEAGGSVLSPTAPNEDGKVGSGLASWVEPGTIRVWRNPVSREQAMKDLVNALARKHPDLDPKEALIKLLERESQGSTFLNDGVALPHARLKGLKSPLVGLGLCHGGIPDVPVQNPIEVVFLLFSPEGQNKSHLQLLALAARLMQNRGLRKKLAEVRGADEAFEVLQSWDGKSGG
jgi:two-component system sensor histidine kinase KdpD